MKMQKRILIFTKIVLLFIMTSNLLFGQYTKTTRTTKVIIPQRAIYLNGGLRATTGGKSRVTIPINLPEHTIEWYYSFSTSAGVSGTKNLNLALQLSSYLVDQTGTTAQFMNKVQVPAGSKSIDIYLLNSSNRTAFIQKWDNNGGTYSYIPEGTTQNTRQATVKINGINSGNWYLGLKNPSSLDGVNIFIEVTAIVENKIYIDEWTDEEKNKIKTNCLEIFNTSLEGKSDVCDCLVHKITVNNLPSAWLKYYSSMQQKIVNAELNSCYRETNNLELKEGELA